MDKKSMLAMALSARKPMALGGMADTSNQAADMKEHYSGIADAILAKRRAAQMPSGEESSSPMNTFGELATDAESYDSDQLDEQPEDSNEHGDEIESDSHDMVSSIRKKMKAKRT